jgi:hypothetical protein
VKIVSVPVLSDHHILRDQRISGVLLNKKYPSDTVLFTSREEKQNCRWGKK